MNFARPILLWCLLTLPALALWMLRGRWRRAQAWRKLGHRGRPPREGGWAWLAAIGLLVVALAGPRWGRVPGSEPPPGHDVVLLVDVSRSMAAEDAVPDRLGLAVEAAEALLAEIGREPGGRVAVVAFAGRGVPRCPLTENLGAVVDVLRGLRPGEVQPGGSDLGAGLAAALDAFDPGRQPEPVEGRTIVVFSDGEDHEPAWDQVLPALDEARVIVHAIAVGDDQDGHPIPAHDPAHPERDVLTWHDELVSTRRHDAALQAIAGATGGAFLPVGLAPPSGLDALYRERIAPVARQVRGAGRTPERVDRYRLVVVAAVLVGVVGSWPGWRRFTFAGLAALTLMPGAAGFQGDPDTKAGAAARTSSARVADLMRMGGELYARGAFPEALAAFERADRLDPTSPLPRYNAAATLFALGRHAEAAASYGEARERADAGLRTKIDYALGNAAVALGDFDSAIAFYDACLGSSASGPGLDSVRRDAEINRAFAERYRQVQSEPAPAPEPEGTPAPGPDPSEGGDPRSAPGEPQPGAGEPAPPEADAGQAAAGGASAGMPPPSNSSTEDSPRDRLDQAIENIRRARQARQDVERPPADLDPERKAW